MARTNGPIQVWSRPDTIPTDAQGGYAGGDSTAAAIALFQDSVDMLAGEVADINIGVGSLSATDDGDGTVTLSWTGDATNGGGGDGGTGGTISWTNVIGKPSTFPPSPHVHDTSDLAADGTAGARTYLAGDGTWRVPGNGAEASGGCLRFYDSGVERHTNSTHVNNAITGFGEAGDGVDIFDTSGRLIVKHKLYGPAIITVGAFPDETLSARGITAGISGGVGTSLVQLVQNGVPLDLREDADYAKVAGPYSNLWMFWLHHGPSGADMSTPITEA